MITRVALASLVLAAVLLPARAADLPTKAPPMVAPALSWTGFYVGANVGYAWARVRATDAPASNGVCWATCGTHWGPDVDSVTGGLQAGWNWQIQNWVLGIEGDVGYLGLKGSAADPVNDDELLVTTRDGWFATIRGRAGVLFSPAVLFYGTGGAIYADTRADVSRATTGFYTDKTDSWGWTAGGGVEARLGPAWSWKLEYLYFDLGSERVSGPIGATGIIQYFPIDQSGHIIRFGINYMFGGHSPVIGRARN